MPSRAEISSSLNIFHTNCRRKKEGPNTSPCSFNRTDSVSSKANFLEHQVSLRYILQLLLHEESEGFSSGGSDSSQSVSPDNDPISTTADNMGGPSGSGGKKKGDADEEGIETPHPHDVLLGRGNFVNNHPGNEHFRSLVRMNKVAYVSTPKNQKPAYARRIVDAIEALDPPGRFLKQNDSTKFWTQVDRRKALDKTRQALREGAPQLVKYLTGDEEEAAAAAAASGGSPPASGNSDPAGRVISTSPVNNMNGAHMTAAGYHQTLGDAGVQNHSHAVHNGDAAGLDPAISMSQPPGVGMHASLPTSVHRQSVERETEESSPAWDNLMRQVTPAEGGLEDVLSRQQQQLEQQLQQQQLQLQMRIQQQQLEFQQQHQRMREQEQRKLEQQQNQREEKHQQHVYDQHPQQEQHDHMQDQHAEKRKEEDVDEDEEEYEEDMLYDDPRYQMNRMSFREASQGGETTEEVFARQDKMLLSRRNLLQRTRSLSLEDVTLLKRGNSVNRSGLGALSSVDMDDPDSGLSQLFQESLGLSQSSDIGGISRKLKRDRSRRSLLDSDSAMSFSTLIDFNESYNPSFRDD